MKPDMRAVIEMYRIAETSVKLEGEMSKRFQVKVGVRKNLVFSPLLFAIFIDVLSDELVKTIREFLCVDDSGLVGKNWKKVEEKYVESQKASKLKVESKF